MKKIFLLTIALLSFALSFANEKNPKAGNREIVGHVMDYYSGEHIPYATVVVENSTLGTAADGSGHFILKGLGEGVQTIEVSMVGYTPQTLVVEPSKTSHSTSVSVKLKEDVLMVDQVVVSSNRSATTRRKSPSLVSTLSGELFESVGARSLAEGLPFQSGVRIEDNCQNCGFVQVRINGLDGHYSQILVDSRPVFSALTSVYGLEQIPASMIDRVEVVRGGGSALYGSSAIGGTINIITKTPTYSSAEFNQSFMSIGMTGAIDSNTTASASMVTDNQKAGISLFAQVRDKDSYDSNGDGFSEIPTINSKTFGVRSFLKTGENSKLSLQYDGTSEFRRGGDMLDRPAHEANIAEQVNHLINGFGASFDILSDDYSRKFNVFSSLQFTDRDSYYGGGQDMNAYGTTNENLWVSGAQLSQKWDRLWFMPAETILGLEYNYNNLQDETIGYDYSFTQRVDIVSAYFQNEWSNDKWGFLIGGRVDKNSLLDNVVFSPRANLRYNPTKNVNFRATYSTGFRAPQAFDEDLHIAVVGGERVVNRLAEDLRQEKSQSLSLSADLYKTFGSVSTNLLIEGFYTRLDDVFTMRELSEPLANGSVVMERYNGSGATVKGVTVEAKAALPSQLQFQVGATYQNNRYDEAEEWSSDPEVAAESRMFRTPDLYGYFTASYNPVKDLTLSLSATYTGEMLVQHFAGPGSTIERDTAFKTPDFFDANAKVSYDFTLVNSVRSQVYVGIHNIFNAYQSDFDKGGDRDSGYIYGPSLPRSLSCGVKFMF